MPETPTEKFKRAFKETSEEVIDTYMKEAFDRLHDILTRRYKFKDKEEYEMSKSATPAAFYWQIPSDKLDAIHDGIEKILDFVIESIDENYTKINGDNDCKKGVGQLYMMTSFLAALHLTYDRHVFRSTFQAAEDDN